MVAIFCRALLADRVPTINGDGEQTRDYVYVSDVVRANLLALDSGEVGHFNVGTGRQTDVNQLYALITQSLELQTEAEHGPARPGDQLTSALDSDLIASKLGWRPAVALEKGVETTAAWFRSVGQG